MIAGSDRPTRSDYEGDALVIRIGQPGSDDATVLCITRDKL
jgi:hypothetical protein